MAQLAQRSPNSITCEDSTVTTNIDSVNSAPIKTAGVADLFALKGILAFTILAVATLMSPVQALTAVPDYATLVEQQRPTVVKVSARKTVQATNRSQPDQRGQQRSFPGPRQAPAQGLGSGVVISPDGYIVTNHHVIDGADSIVVSFYNREEHTAELIGSDPRTDLALLKVDTDPLKAATLGDTSALKVGQWVIAIGAPFGFDFTATQGIISALSRSLPSNDSNYVPFIQTDVAVNPGNSGGPLFNTAGEVVGINSQIYTRSGGFMGLSFAIPSNVVMNVTDQLRTKGYVSRGWLGVTIQEVDQALAESFGMDTPRGSLIAEVVADGPAEQAQLQAGDIILSFNGSEIRRSAELPALVGTVIPGDTVDAVILRGGEEQVLAIKIGELAGDKQVVAGSTPESTGLGVRVRALDANEKSERALEHGVLIESVEPGSLAANAGLQAGDVLLEFNGTTLHSAQDLKTALSDAGDRESVAARIDREGNSRFIPLRIK